MKIQVLVATMNQKDHSLIKKMNIKTNAIIGNQCSINSIENFMVGNQEIKYLNFSERGVGLNRNNALMRANADICVFFFISMLLTATQVEDREIEESRWGSVIFLILCLSGSWNSFLEAPAAQQSSKHPMLKLRVIL